MYCEDCGREIPDKSTSCSFCGSSTNCTPAVVEESNGFLWCLLGFCVPIVGLVLYLIWKDEKPKTAKAAGKGALIMAILYAVFLAVYIGFIAIGIFVVAINS